MHTVSLHGATADFREKPTGLLLAAISDLVTAGALPAFGGSSGQNIAKSSSRRVCSLALFVISR
jgi:hypothetical protein